MKAIALTIPEIILLKSKVFGDDRGFFFESFNQRQFAALTGRDVNFAQDNHSRSGKNVLCGLNYQIHHPQGKHLTEVEYFA
jgi:dTDP-4-dehydrorhamnose 3,5-epimerase